VTVSGAAVRNGSAELAPLEDVTDKIDLDVLSTDYERKSNRLTVRVKLKNTSDQAVEGPLKLRLIDLDSELGTRRPPTPKTESRARARSGASTPSSQAGRSSRVRSPGRATLTFRLSEFVPSGTGRRSATGS
jgi:hypothetical protein